MAERTKAQLRTDINSQFADNEAGEITEARLRSVATDIVDSLSDFSGDYGDLRNPPDIPDAQVPADWAAVAGVSRILNKPTIPDRDQTARDAAAAAQTTADGKITQAQADARVRALVADEAEEGNTNRWAKSKLPADTVYQSALDSVRATADAATTTAEATRIADTRAAARYTDAEKSKLSGLTQGLSQAQVDARVRAVPGPVLIVANIASYDATANRFEDSGGNPVIVPNGAIVTLTQAVYDAAVSDAGFTPNANAIFLTR